MSIAQHQQLKALEQKVRELEARIAQLEAKPEQKKRETLSLKVAA